MIIELEETKRSILYNYLDDFIELYDEFDDFEIVEKTNIILIDLEFYGGIKDTDISFALEVLYEYIDEIEANCLIDTLKKLSTGGSTNV